MRRRWSSWLFLAAILCFANVLNAAESQEVKKVSLEVSSDFDFDSNATQQNNLPADVATTGKRSSIVYTQTLKAQYDLNPAGPFNLQAKYEYFQNFHTHAGFVDTMYHTWFLTPSAGGQVGVGDVKNAFGMRFTPIHKTATSAVYLLQIRK